MIKRLSILAGILAIAGMALAAFAPAASAADPRPRPGTVLAGRGVLDAEGNGLVAIKGRIDLEVSADRGILLVKDLAGNAKVEVEGEGGTAQFHGFTAYFGTGSATITGSNVAVIMVGNDIKLHVVGSGWAYLRGRGTFMVNNRGPFPWNAEGNFAPVGPDPEPTPTEETES